MKITHSGMELHLRYGGPGNAHTSYQYQLVRLLLGTVSISGGGKRIEQKIDYSFMPGIPQSVSPSVAMKGFLNGFNFYSQSRFIDMTKGENRAFYKEVLHDLGNYFIASSKGSHVSAFVFIYRVLERMLYAAPLIYASTAKEFEGSFGELKSVLQGKDDGELNLYDRVINSGRFIDQVKLDNTYGIDFSASGTYKKNYYDIIEKQLLGKLDNLDAHGCKADIKFRHIGKSICNIRNRFFHTKTGGGQKNISTSEIGDAEGFFEVMNCIFISYISIVLLQMVSWARIK